MAHMSQENKKSKEPLLKALMKQYGIKGSVSVHHYSTLVLNIKAGKVDFIGNYNKVCKAKDHSKEFIELQDGYIQVNEYYLDSRFSGDALEFLKEAKKIMQEGNHNNSDVMTDYFDIGWYIDINIGEWNQPYIFIP